MTLDDYIRITNYTPEKQKDFIGNYGQYGGDIDFAVTPAGVELNGVHAVFGEAKREFYTWEQINEHILEQDQIRFF